MTETAEMADIVLPATMFLEHNDYYTPRRPHARALRPEARRGAGRGALQLRGRSTSSCAASAATIRSMQMTDREMVAETLPPERLRRARRDREDRLRRARAARGRAALRQRLCLARREVPLRAELAGRRGQEGLPLGLRSRPSCRASPTGGTSTSRRAASIPSASRPAPRARSSTRAFPRPPAARSASRRRRSSSAPMTQPPSASPMAMRSSSATAAAKSR